MEEKAPTSIAWCGTSSEGSSSSPHDGLSQDKGALQACPWVAEDGRGRVARQVEFCIPEAARGTGVGRIAVAELCVPSQRFVGQILDATAALTTR